MILERAAEEAASASPILLEEIALQGQIKKIDREIIIQEAESEFPDLKQELPTIIRGL